LLRYLGPHLEKEFLMRHPNRWTVFAVAHLIVLCALTAAILLVGLRLGANPVVLQPPASTRLPAATLAVPGTPDAAVAQLGVLSARMDVLANNLANAETIAFKRRRADIEAGTVPKLSRCLFDMSQGPLESTGAPLDVAIEGDGFIHIKVRPTLQGGDGYTRNGALMRNSAGDLVVGMGEGYELIPPINLPKGAANISISQDGIVQYTTPGTNRVSKAGQIQLITFANPQSLDQVDGVYLATDGSGPPITNSPGENNSGTLLGGYLENSNVNTVKESAELVRTRKMLEFCSRSFGLGEIPPARL
jgi:flagellar basal-body rod protein FlgG